MIKEALQYLTDLARKGYEPHILEAKQEADDRYYLVENGTAELLTARPSPRRHAFYSLGAFVDAVNVYEADLRVPTERVAVFAGRGKITAILNDDSDRRDRLKMVLPYTIAFAKLAFLAEARSLSGIVDVSRGHLSQRNFLNMLRIVFAGCVDADVVASFRNLSQRVENQADGTVGHGSESMGRRILAEVLNEGNTLPEEIKITTPVYENWGLNEPAFITCAVDIDPHELTIAMIPQGGQLEDAIRTADESVINYITGHAAKDVQVFMGAV